MADVEYLLAEQVSAEEQAAEILRLADIFMQGCGNTLSHNAWECPVCTDDFLSRVKKVINVN